jgi:hypothetical protein
MKKIALKRLSKSDLTFFIWHFQNSPAGNQKAINLNADVFIDTLFPALPDEAAKRAVDRFSVDLDIFGPRGASKLNLQRKIVKGEAYKNWRLNGEFVRDDESRFQVLKEGDLALFDFDGDTFPFAARLVLLSGAQPEDAAAHLCLDRWLDGRRMARITPQELERLIQSIALAENHPLLSINLDDELEDAALGGLLGTQRLLKRKITRKVTRQELKQARNQTDEIGSLGEEFVNEFLNGEREKGAIKSFVWSSRENAIEPFDFELNEGAERIDAKATSGPFVNPIHVSINELLHSADAGIPYRIYRVYDVAGRRARMRISEPLEKFASSIVPILESLPEGVMADGLSIDPRKIRFGPEVVLELNPVDDE